MGEQAHRLRFPLHFTQDAPPAAMVKRDVRIRDADGRVVFSADGVEVPEAWSQLATDIFASKYLHRPAGETSARQAVGRIVLAIRRAGRLRHVFASPTDEEAFAAELEHILLHQRAAFNSPVWFNLGLHEAYGLRGREEQFVYEEGEAVVADSYERPQVSACFIQGLQDSLTGPGGIFDLLRREAHIFRHGSGTGTNFSVLRSRQEPIARGGTSSGVLSFLRVFDAAAGATKSGGTTRRAAKMVVLDVDHPEVLEFIHWKEREEDKARALIAAGMQADWEGEAYASVSGQHGNNSLRVPDAFMDAVVGGGLWSTRFRTSGEVCQEVPVRKLWDGITQAAWACGDPGLQFQDTIARWHTCAPSGPIRATNPCSEFVFLDDTACNLASINLLRFWDGSAFDVDGLRHTVRVLVTAMDILVDHAGYPTPEIARNSVRLRPLGLGFANLGALCMALGLPYDSDEARAWAAAVTSLLSGSAYAASAELAAARGAFPASNDQGESGSGTRNRTRTNGACMADVVARHVEAARHVATIGAPDPAHPGRLPAEAKPVAAAGVAAWQEALQAGRWRNAQLTVVAPTGTIGLLMDCDTTGIEPELHFSKRKRLAGGGTARLVNQSLAAAVARLGYPQSDEMAARIEAAGSATGIVKPEHEPVFHTAMAASQGGAAIAPSAHVRMLAAVQPLLSGGISKTVNLPRDATPDDIGAIYLLAWRLGLKSISVYRDGSKASQPLTGDTPLCPDCQHATQRSGTCFRCTNCGTVLGCS